MAATITHNHVNYQARLDFIQHLLREQFNVKENVEIIPIQYDAECPFKYNNFIYRVSVSTPFTAIQNASRQQQPGCVAIPDGTKEFILRLTNADAEGLSPEARVENEVAIISLASDALRGYEPHIVPDVYAWGSAGDTSVQGWIMQEFMPGTPLDEAFQAMDPKQKGEVLQQKASILKALQDYQLPENISFGGVIFDDDGKIVSSTMTIVGAGPWPSFEASFKQRLEEALEKSDVNPYIKGWRANGVRDRLDPFVERGVPARFESLGDKNDRAIVHGDFTLNNILFDTVSGRITALIDYDLACISHPSYEFFSSFHDAGGQFPGWSADEDGEETTLRKAKLSGVFPSPLPPKIDKYGTDWEVVQAWEEALEKLEVKRPSTMSGIDKVADINTILDSIVPWRLSNSDILRRKSEEDTLRYRDGAEKRLISLLEHVGY